MKQIELAWLAGIIDGEGYVGLTTGGNQPPNRPHVTISNNDKAIADRILQVFKTLGIERITRNDVKKSKGYNYRIVLSNTSEIKTLLTKTYKYLTGWKQDRARIVIEACSLHYSLEDRKRRVELVKDYEKYRSPKGRGKRARK